jgi:acyl carrier protein
MSGATPEACAGALEAFIRANFQIGDDDPYFDRNVNLWEEGYVDSTGVVEVIAFLEETFGVTIPEEMLFSPDFTSIGGMSKLVTGLEAARLSAECSAKEPEVIGCERESTRA